MSINRWLPLAVGIVVSAAQAEAFELTSPDFNDGDTLAEVFVFDGFGCTGGNISPALGWTGAPEGTESLALMVHDPDAPTGGAGFWHWIVLGIPATVQELPQDAGAAGGDKLPVGARMLANDYGIGGWGGPCPPEGHGPHRYDFTLYALPTAELEVPEGASTAVTGFIINANAIATARLQGIYER